MKGVQCFGYVTSLAGVAGDMVHHIKVTLTVFYHETQFEYCILLCEPMFAEIVSG